MATVNTLLVGTTEVHPEEIPWIEEDGETGLEWSPDAEVRILRVPPFALGIARKAVEEFVLERYGPDTSHDDTGHAPGNGNGKPRSLPTVTGERLDEAIQKLAWQGLMDVRIGPRRALRALIGLQQNACPRQPIRRGFAGGNQSEEVLSFCRS